jgi:hypothetical protein
VTRAFGARPETLRVIGRVRAIVAARDGVWTGVDRMVPWLTRIEWAGQWIECRMDSISWATDMNESDYVYDAGRVIGDKGIVLWASRGFRPRFIRSSAPLAREAGTIEVHAGDPPLTMKLESRDVAGNVARRTVVIRPGLGPDTTRAFVVKNPKPTPDRFDFTALPDGYLRVTYQGKLAGARGLRISLDHGGPWLSRPAAHGPLGSTAVFHPEAGVPLLVRAWTEPTAPRGVGPFYVLAEREGGALTREAKYDWELPEDARFDSSVYLFVPWQAMPFPASSGELEQVHETPTVHLEPESEPLRGRLRLKVHASEKPHAGVYRFDEDGWTWVGDERKGGDYAVTSGRLGWFAEFVDTLGPRITLRTPARSAAAGPYNRWAIEAAITEKGSGMNGRASYMVVDGKKVAAEWDPEADVLRWRPLAPPTKGAHKYDVVVEDRAGNQSVRSGTFVLD